MGRRRSNEWDGWEPSALDSVEVTHLEPLFPLWYLTPDSTCNHSRERIRKGSIWCCMVCHQSGQDHRPMAGVPVGSRINPEWEDEIKPTVYAPDPPAKTETRKERRRKQFAGQPSQTEA